MNNTSLRPPASAESCKEGQPQILLALAERCEREEASRALDLEIANALLGQGEPHWMWLRDDDFETVTRWVYGPAAPGNPVCGLEQFTDSLDGAVTLVPEGWVWDVASTGQAWVMADVPDMIRDDQHHTCTSAQNPALALCAAALRARAALAKAQP